MKLPALQPLVSHLRELPPSDKFIVGTLSVILLVLMLVGLYNLERQFLVEVPSHGGGLTEGVVGHPRFINPLLALSDPDRDLVLLTYAGLMGYDASGKLIPVLAQSYEISEDGKVYTFHMRPNAEFSDGTPVTAQDVVFTTAKAQDPGLKSPRLADFTNVSVEAVDATTVQFTLPKAYAPFLEEMTLGILPAHLWQSVSNEEFPFSLSQAEPVGAGPFKVAHIARDKAGLVERYELVRNDHYVLGRPYLAHITFVYFDDEETLREAFLRGRIESAHGVAGSHVIKIPYSRIFGVFFNQGENPALAKLEVRKALSVAVDRNMLVKDVLDGNAIPAYGPVPPNLKDATATPQNSVVGIDEAREILLKGGWQYSEEERIWKHDKDNLSLSVTLTTSNVPELKAVAEALRSTWEQLGVATSIEFFDPNTLVLSSIRPRKYEALLFGMVVGKDKDFFAFWDSSQRNDPGLNVSLYTNLRVDELLDEIREESNVSLLPQKLSALDALIAADYPAVFTHAPTFLYAVPSDLKGVVFETVAAPSDRFQTIAFWHRHTEFLWPFIINE